MDGSQHHGRHTTRCGCHQVPAPRGGSSPTPSRRRAFRYGVSAVLGSSSPAEILRLDQAIIALALSRYTLGLYVVAVAFTNLPRFISQSVGIVAFPRVAAGVGAETHRLVQHYPARSPHRRYCRRGPGGHRGMANPGALRSCVRRRGPYGPDSSDRIAMSCHAADPLGHRSGPWLSNRRHSRRGCEIAIALPLVVVAAPLYGIEGAAIALTLGAIVSLVVLALMVLRRQRVAARDRIDSASRVDRPPINAIALGGDGTS